MRDNAVLDLVESLIHSDSEDDMGGLPVRQASSLCPTLGYLVAWRVGVRYWGKSYGVLIYVVHMKSSSLRQVRYNPQRVIAPNSLVSICIASCICPRARVAIGYQCRLAFGCLGLLSTLVRCLFFLHLLV